MLKELKFTLNEVKQRSNVIKIMLISLISLYISNNNILYISPNNKIFYEIEYDSHKINSS